MEWVRLMPSMPLAFLMSAGMYLSFLPCVARRRTSAEGSPGG